VDGDPSTETSADGKRETKDGNGARTRLDGTNFGRFQITRRLGRGGFGDVFLGIDPQLDREVALKVLRTDILVRSRTVQRFLLEAKAAGQLRHPHIVPVYDAGQWEGRYFIASAYIAGGSLDDKLKQGPTPDLRWAAETIMHLALALDYAHDCGVVHRDVKPANILLDNHEQPHITDFGLARVDSSDTKVTRAGYALGTPDYMPPEQARGDLEKISPASDQYSLGVTLYELLCGKTPFSGDSVQDVIQTLINQEPVRPRQLNRSIPLDLETICLKAMMKEPAQRYPSCGDFAEDLRRWLAGEPIKARRINLANRLVRWCRREPRIAGLTIGIFLVTLVGMIVAMWQSGIATANANRANANETIALQNEQRANENESRAIDSLTTANRERYRLAVLLAREETETGNVAA
jgi:serine/threonine protein kinase